MCICALPAPSAIALLKADEIYDDALQEFTSLDLFRTVQGGTGF